MTERSKMEKVYNFLMTLSKWVTIVLAGLLLSITTIGVFARYILNSSISWGEEFGAFNLVWLLLWSSVICLHEKKHLGFELFFNTLPPWLKRHVRFFGNLLILIFLVIVGYGGVIMTLQFLNQGTDSIPSMPLGVFYIVLPICSVLMSLVIIHQTIGLFSNRKKEDKSDL